MRLLDPSVGSEPLRMICAGHHVFEGMAHPPIQVSGGQIAGGDNPVGIPWAPGRDLRLEIDLCDLSGCVHALVYGDPFARSQFVDPLEGYAGVQRPCCGHV